MCFPGRGLPAPGERRERGPHARPDTLRGLGRPGAATALREDAGRWRNGDTPRGAPKRILCAPRSTLPMCFASSASSLPLSQRLLARTTVSSMRALSPNPRRCPTARHCVPELLLLPLRRPLFEARF